MRNFKHNTTAEDQLMVLNLVEDCPKRTRVSIHMRSKILVASLANVSFCFCLMLLTRHVVALFLELNFKQVKNIRDCESVELNVNFEGSQLRDSP